MTSRLRRPIPLLAALAAALCGPGAAHALTIEVSFTASTHQVQAGDDFASLLAEHHSGAVLGAASVATLDGVATSVHAPGHTTDYSVLMSVELVAAQGGLYSFQAGVDWGRGGVAAVVDADTGTVVSQLVRTDDLWWANDWGNPDVFTTSASLAQGTSYRLAWIGFEGCCAGSSTIRFSFEGSPFVPLDATSLAPYDAPAAIAEPRALALWLLVGLGSLRVRR